MLVGQDVAGRDKDVVDSNPLATVRHVEGVVEDSVCLVVGEAIKVPVGVAGQHDRGLLGQGEGDDLEVPLHVLQGVGDIRHHLAGEALLPISVVDREGDAIVGVRDNGEVTPVPPIGTSVEGVETLGELGCLVLVGPNLVLHTVDLKSAVLDAVGIPPGNATKVIMLLVLREEGGVVEARDDVPLDSVLVMDHQVGYRGSVRDKSRRDAFAIDPVLPIFVRLRRRLSGISAGMCCAERRQQGCQSKQTASHDDDQMSLLRRQTD